MNGDSLGSSSSNPGGGQDANGNLSNNLGARPKVRSGTKFSNAGDQVVPQEIRDDNDEKEENSDADDDFYVYR